MKEIQFIEFVSGWVPPAYRKIRIIKKRFLYSQMSEKGDWYAVCSGCISDDDATYLRLMEPKAKIKDVEDTKYMITEEQK